MSVMTSSGASFVIGSTFGIVSMILMASDSSLAAQVERPVASPAAQEADEHSDPRSSIPSVGRFYVSLEEQAGTARVSFVQHGDVLTATWMTATGEVYGRGTYRWDPTSRSFTGKSTTRSLCFWRESGVDDTYEQTTAVMVQEQLYVVNDRELIDRWTKPLRVDCTSGAVEIFKWVEHTWLATDEDWKPLGPDLAPTGHASKDERPH